MENLLCTEDFLSNSSCELSSNNDSSRERFSGCFSSNSVIKEDCNDAFNLYLQQEENSCLLHSEYVKRLTRSELIDARANVIDWIIQSHETFNLSWATVFCSVNLLDQFLSDINFEVMRFWVFELLSIVCLSISAKLEDVYVPLLSELQGAGGLYHTFESSTVQQMELIVSTKLAWRLRVVTSYSFGQALLGLLDINIPHLFSYLEARVMEYLLATLTDVSFLQFKPCSVAASAILCGLEEVFPLTLHQHITKFDDLIPFEKKEDIRICVSMMDNLPLTPTKRLYSPPSPSTVLGEQVRIMDCNIDLSLLVTSFNERRCSDPRKLIK